jgi:hypothetical protein
MQKLTVIQDFGTGKVLCKCYCGNETWCTRYQLKNDTKKSCGCLKKQAFDGIRFSGIKHGKCKSRFYNVWRNIMRRCYEPTFPNYKTYGGRGITVCSEWRDDRVKFIEWAEKHNLPADFSIERIDNDKEYSPENCTWIPRVEQAKNKQQTYWVTYNGSEMCLSDFAIKHGNGLHESTIRYRLQTGYSPEDAIKPAWAFKRRKMSG